MRNVVRITAPALWRRKLCGQGAALLGYRVNSRCKTRHLLSQALLQRVLLKLVLVAGLGGLASSAVAQQASKLGSVHKAPLDHMPIAGYEPDGKKTYQYVEHMPEYKQGHLKGLRTYWRTISSKPRPRAYGC